MTFVNSLIKVGSFTNSQFGKITKLSSHANNMFLQYLRLTALTWREKEKEGVQKKHDREQ